jgi:peptidoglycan/LPS O-acetylase OafA/YrhL
MRVPSAAGAKTTETTQPSDASAVARVPELDGLRGLAILFVVLFHQLLLFPRPPSGTFGSTLFQAACMTWSGIDIFFVLSGFLIGGILLDQRDARRYFLPFYVRRTCRIFPLYFAWLALYVVFSRIAHGIFSPLVTRALVGDPLPFWSYATFTQNFIVARDTQFGPHWLGVTWSLAVEEQFYLVFPLVIRFTPRRALPGVMLAAIASAPLIRTLLYSLSPAGLVAGYVLMPCRADDLLLGGLAAWAVRQEGVFPWLRSHQLDLRAAFAVLLLGVVGLAVRTPALASPGMTYFGYTWLGIFYLCLLLIAISARRGTIKRIMLDPWLRRLGRISYGVYLIHQAVTVIVFGLLVRHVPAVRSLRDFAVMWLALAITVAIASLSWRYFERPVVAWGHSFAYRKS